MSYLVTVGIIFNIYYWLIFSFFMYACVPVCVQVRASVWVLMCGHVCEGQSSTSALIS